VARFLWPTVYNDVGYIPGKQNT